MILKGVLKLFNAGYMYKVGNFKKVLKRDAGKAIFAPNFKI